MLIKHIISRHIFSCNSSNLLYIIICPTCGEEYFKKKLYGPFLWMGFNCLKATATLRRQFTFYHSVPRNSWYSFYQSRKDERLSRPWNHPVVLNMGPLDWESSALTTRPLLHNTVVKLELVKPNSETVSESIKNISDIYLSIKKTKGRITFGNVCQGTFKIFPSLQMQSSEIDLHRSYKRNFIKKYNIKLNNL